MHVFIDDRLDTRMDWYMYIKRIYRQTVKWMDAWVDRQMGKQADGWINEHMGGWAQVCWCNMGLVWMSVCIHFGFLGHVIIFHCRKKGTTSSFIEWLCQASTNFPRGSVGTGWRVSWLKRWGRQWNPTYLKSKLCFSPIPAPIWWEQEVPFEISPCFLLACLMSTYKMLGLLSLRLREE